MLAREKANSKVGSRNLGGGEAAAEAQWKIGEKAISRGNPVKGDGASEGR